jgi:hypothetical protein
MILWLLSTLAVREMIATLSLVVIAALIYYVRDTKMKSQCRKLPYRKGVARFDKSNFQAQYRLTCCG